MKPWLAPKNVETTFLGSKRLVLQCEVVNANVLTAASPLIPAATLNDLHLTVFHIGKSYELFGEVSAESGIALDLYEARMVAYLRRCTERSHASYHGIVTSSGVLASGRKSYAVAFIEPESALLQARTKCRQDFLEMLSHDGIAEPEVFMRESAVVQQHSPDWLPHVTLSSEDANPSIGAGLVGRQLEFGPLHVRRS